jgi:hypothetical protein
MVLPRDVALWHAYACADVRSMLAFGAKHAPAGSATARPSRAETPPPCPECPRRRVEHTRRPQLARAFPPFCRLLQPVDDQQQGKGKGKADTHTLALIDHRWRHVPDVTGGSSAPQLARYVGASGEKRKRNPAFALQPLCRRRRSRHRADVRYRRPSSQPGNK